MKEKNTRGGIRFGTTEAVLLAGRLTRIILAYGGETLSIKVSGYGNSDKRIAKREKKGSLKKQKEGKKPSDVTIVES